MLNKCVERDIVFLHRVATGDLGLVILHILRSDCHTHGHTLELVLIELPAGTLGIIVVELHGNSEGFQFLNKRIYLSSNLFALFIGLVNRDNDHLDRSQNRRQNQSVVIGVSHDERTDESGGNAP